jgi:hypothetical protein
MILALVRLGPVTLIVGVVLLAIGVVLLLKRDQLVAYQARLTGSDPASLSKRVMLPAIGYIVLGLFAIAVALRNF